MGERRAQAEQTIHAGIDAVWRALIGVHAYGEWNPFVVAVAAPAGAPDVGTDMRFDVRWTDGARARSRERVTVFRPPARGEDGVWEAEWTYRYASALSTIGMIRVTRTQRLLQLDGDEITRYIGDGVFRGWGVAFVPLAKVQAGFEAQGAALRRRCETEAPEGDPPRASWPVSTRRRAVDSTHAHGPRPPREPTLGLAAALPPATEPDRIRVAADVDDRVAARVGRLAVGALEVRAQGRVAGRWAQPDHRRRSRRHPSTRRSPRPSSTA